MQKTMAFLFLALMALPAVLMAQQDITLTEMWTTPRFFPKGVSGMKPMQDGDHFAKVARNMQTGRVYLIQYPYEGNDSTILFDSKWLPEEQGSISIEDFSFSPSENFLLLQTSTIPIYRHSKKSIYYIWDRENRKLSPLASQGHVMFPEFNPQEEKVAYVQENDLYIQNLETGKVTAVTTDGEKNEIINGASDWVYEEEFKLVKAFHWNPTGDKLAWIKFNESEVEQMTIFEYSNQEYPEPYEYKYPKVGFGNSILSVHVYDDASGKKVLVDVGEENDQYLPRIKWTNDPQTLAIQRMNRLQNKLEILFADAATGKTRVVMVETSDTYIDVTDDWTFLEDNDFIWTSDKSGFNHIYLYDRDGELKRQITSGDWPVTDFLGVDEEEKTVFYASAEKSPLERQVYSISLKGKRKRPITPQAGWNEASFSKNYEYFIHTHSDALTPPSVYIRNENGGMVKVLEENKELAEVIDRYNWQEKEFFTFETVDGTNLNAWRITPPNFDETKEYPVLITLYGGPGSQTVTNQWSSYNDVWYQYMAQQGIIIISVDPRGTGARGRDFQKQTYLKLGELETEDLVAMAKWLGQQEYIDDERIGIFGWSYGGYMASLAITKGAEQFDLAVAVAPVTDWRWYDNIYTERYMQTVELNPEGYQESSVLNYADQLEGDFLLVHGTFDDNVHPQHSFELSKQLVMRNIPFDSEFYTNKNHGIYGGYTRLHLFSKISNFITENFLEN